MLNSKEKFKKKVKWCKIFTNRVNGTLVRKLSAVALSLALVTSGSTALNRAAYTHTARVTEAEGAAPTIPNNMFITGEELVTLCKETNNGEGLQSDAKNSVVLKVNFGYRPEPVLFYEVDHHDSSIKHEASVGRGPISWLVLGYDKGERSGREGLVVCADAPLISANALKYKDNSGVPSAEGTDSRYQVDENTRSYHPEPDSGYGNVGEVTVDYMHWGASVIRRTLQTLQQNASWFCDEEQKLMLVSKLDSRDTRNNLIYNTKDVLYLPDDPTGTSGRRAADGCFGEVNSINTDAMSQQSGDATVINARGLCFLRGCTMDQKDRPVLGHYNVTSGASAFGSTMNEVDSIGAFKLDSHNLCFASAASAVTKTGVAAFSQIPSGRPMDLRLRPENSDLRGASIQADGVKLNYSAPAGTRLLAIAAAADGNTYEFSKIIDADAEGEVLDLKEVAEFPTGQAVAGKAWIETEAGGQLTYATDPVDFPAEGAVTPDPKPQPEQPQGPGSAEPENPTGEHVFEYKLGDGGFVRVIDRFGQIPGTWRLVVEPMSGSLSRFGYDANLAAETEHGQLYQIYFVDENGTKVESLNLDNQVEVWVPVPDGYDLDDLKIYYLMQNAEDAEHRILHMERENGHDYAVFETNHFSPYALIDILNEREKSALNASKTGDALTTFTISAFAIIMILALGIMISSKIKKKKFDD